MGREEGEVSLPCLALHPFCLLLSSKTTEFALGPFPGAAGLLERSLIPHTWLGQHWAGLRAAGPAALPSQPTPLFTAHHRQEKLCSKNGSGCSKRGELIYQQTSGCLRLHLCIHALICCLILQPTVVFSSPGSWQGLRCLQKEIGVPKCN